MALTLEPGSITEQADGSYTVAAIVKRQSDNKTVGDTVFEASSPAELKAKIKPYFESLVAEERKNSSMKTATQIVIDEILNEVVQ